MYNSLIPEEVYMSDNENTKGLLHGHFKGDREALRKAVKHGRRNLIKWTDIALNAKLYPEFEATTQDVIQTLLGYNPPANFILPQEAFIRVAINQYINGELTKEQLFTEAELHLKLVRNEVYRDHLDLYYNRDTYARYFTYLPEVAEKAKARLTNFLGYEPALETSVYAEVFLREALIDPEYHFSDNLNTTDMQALTLIRLREILLTQGLDAALASPLPARDLVAAHILMRSTIEKSC